MTEATRYAHLASSEILLCASVMAGAEKRGSGIFIDASTELSLQGLRQRQDLSLTGPKVKQRTSLALHGTLILG